MINRKFSTVGLKKFPAVLIALIIGIAVCYGNDSLLKGKRVALLGDSMTWIGGDSCQNQKGWSHWLNKLAEPDTLMVYARSGATWTNTPETKANPDAYSEVLDDQNVIYNQVVRLIRDADSDSIYNPDVIIVFAGTNDAWFSDKRPGWDAAHPVGKSRNQILATPPSEATSLATSVELVTLMLHERFPKSKLVYITPVHSGKIKPTKIERVAGIIEEEGKRRKVRVLRADKELPITHIQEKSSRNFTTDGVHTNAKGASLIGNYVTNKLSDN